MKCAIIEACHKRNMDEFFKLVKQQRANQPKSTCIDFGEHTADTVSNSWAKYYEQLATPKDDETYDDAYK